MHWLLSDIWNVGIAIGPVLGYVYQYRLIEQNKSVGTFSIKLCGMLLFCNILRIAFYFFRQYSLALLVQSVLMIAVQLFLLRLCVNTMIEAGAFKNQSTEYDEEGFNLFTNFWNWDYLRKYYYVIGIFSIAVIFFSYLFNKLELQFIGEFIGFLSLISESLLMLPQVIENCKQKRVKGLSHLLVGLNNVGDLMKLAFFIVNDQPAQFVFCGILQCFIDGFVIVQIIYYKMKNPPISEQQCQSAEKKTIEEKPDEIVMDNQQLPEKPPVDYKQFQDQS